ncbi:MAG: hypothetical protein OEM23_01720 [Gemmatimonadota bacterium]|nr:hypothetical protein [Gemmatimonadota bacterium]MDH3427130.1 hypothetical protein [Gemmatimonadota bacterium]
MSAPSLKRTVSVLAAALLFAACGPKSADVSSEASRPPTTEDFYGKYEVIFAGSDAATPGNEMIATWNEFGVQVEQMGNPVLQFQMALGRVPGVMEIWNEDGSDPLCLAEGVYDYVDDGTTITFSVVSDGCEERRQSADGGRLVRLD